MLKTPFRQHQEEKDKKIHDLYNHLISQPGNMPTAVVEKVRTRFKYNSRTSVYYALNRHCKRMEHPV